MLVPTSSLQTIAYQLDSAAESFRKKKVLITGSSGFIGNWLSQGLSYLNEHLGLDMELIFLSRKIDSNFRENISKYKTRSITFIETDLTNDNFSQIQVLKNLDFVFHTATTLTNLEAQIRNSVAGFAILGTSKLINVIRASQEPPVFIHLSSGAVYGHHSSESGLISEDTKFDKNVDLSSYGYAKRQIEDLVISASKEGLIVGTNPRLFSFFGPSLPLDIHFAIGNFVGNAISGKNIQVTGSPNSSRSYLYVGDLVRKLLLLSIKPTAETIHIGSAKPINMLALASTVKEVVNDKIEVELTNLNTKANHYVPSVRKSNLYLEDYSEISLSEGLQIWKQWLLDENISGG